MTSSRFVSCARVALLSSGPSLTALLSRFPQKMFTEFGDIVGAKIRLDRQTHRSKGFGFVTFANLESAQAAISQMHGTSYAGRPLTVSDALARGSTKDSDDEDEDSKDTSWMTGACSRCGVPTAALLF
jgi:hypothetical protein